MASFAQLVATMRLNLQNFSTGIRQASSQVRRLANNMSSQLSAALVQPARQAKFAFKDISRIVGGIVVSKIFYSGLNSIRRCTSAVFEFSSALEYAQMTYSNMFGDTSLAEEFINVLKDFAATTPFTFSEAEDAAKRLLAYGIQYKNVMYVVQGIMAASSAQNNPQVIESISRAIGQIYTKGRLMNEEMRQLTEAGIPAYEILSQKLGLTQEQLQSLGKQAIPASKAINALIEGMNERYGGVVNASSKTTQGLISNLKDNLTMLMSGIFEPFINKIKTTLNNVSSLIAKLREIYELRGIGGVFNELVPEKLQLQIRTLVANLKNVWTVVKVLLQAAFNSLKYALYGLMQILNVILPILTAIVDVFARLSLWISKNAKLMRILTLVLTAAAAAWVVYRIQAMATTIVIGVIRAMSNALKVLGAMLTFIAAHPIWAIFIVGIGIVAGLSGAFNTLGQKIRDAFAWLTKVNGYKPSDIFLESQKKRTNDINKFNQALDGTADAMSNVADSTEKAAKKAKEAQKDLLSFDEVFRLKEPDEGADSGIDTDDLADLGDLGSLTDFDTESLLPELPDVDSWASDFVDNIFDALKEKLGGLFDRLKSLGIATIIGGLLGSLVGHPIIGMAIGGLVGWFWDEIKEKLGLSDTQGLAMAICTLLGGAIGSLVGHPFIGMAIGLLCGWIIGSIIEAFQTGDWSKAVMPICTGLGLAIGALLGHPFIGLAIGALVGWIIQSIMEAIETGDWSKAVMPICTGLGLAIGALLGHPFIGLAIGALIGWIVDSIIEAFQTGDWSRAVTPICTGLGLAIGALLGHPILGLAIGGFVGWIINSIRDALETGDWTKAVMPISTGLGLAIGTLLGHPFIGLAIGGIVGWIIDSFTEAIETGDWTKIVTPICLSLGGALGLITGHPILGVVLGGLLSWLIDTFIEFGSNVSGGFIEGMKQGAVDVWESIKSFFDLVIESFKNIFGIHSPATTMMPIGENILLGILEGMKGALEGVLTGIAEVGEPIIEAISGWFTSIKTNISAWSTETAASISSWVSETSSKISSWVSEKAVQFAGWVSSTSNNFSNWSSNTKTKVSEAMTNAGQKIAWFVSESTSKLSGWVSSSLGHIGTWSSGMISSASSAMSNFLTNVRSGLGNALANVGSFCSNALSQIQSWAANVGSWISNTISSATSRVNSFISSINSRISGALSGLRGHATGGVFNKEHIARFAEGNRAEAIIPLENKTAMQPFVDAVADGLAQSFGPILANINSSGSNFNSTDNQLPPMYVGTLIADERSLKELSRKMDVIRLKETKRRGS